MHKTVCGAPRQLERELTRPRGFTLIELLVVIAVLVVLLAILVPSLRTARHIARQTVCMSTMRGLGVALLGYAGENRLTLPGSAWPPDLPTGEERTTWREHIAPFLNNARGAFACAANQARKKDSAYNDLPRSYHANGASVGNWSVVPAPLGKRNTNFGIRHCVRLDEINLASDQILVVEGCGEGATPLTNHPYPADLSWAYDIGRIQRCFYIHPTGTANYTFADGTVRKYRLIDTGQPRNLWSLNLQSSPAPEAWLNKLTQAEWITYPSD